MTDQFAKGKSEILQLARDWKFLGYQTVSSAMKGSTPNGCAQYARDITCADRIVGRIVTGMGDYELQMNATSGFITISKHSSAAAAWQCFIMTYPGALLEHEVPFKARGMSMIQGGS